MIGFASFPVINNLKTSSVFNECDNIILKNGDEVYAKIIEITPEFIKYRKCDKLEGPLISIYKKDILMLRYADGTKEIFNSDTYLGGDSSKQENSGFGLISVFLALISLFYAPDNRISILFFAPFAIVLGIICFFIDKNKTSAIVGTILGFIPLVILSLNSSNDT